MSESESRSDEHLLIHVVSMFTQQAWMAMGKLKNPVTDKVERNLEEASFYIDIVDMLKKRMAGNLSDDEEKFLESSLSSLKMNYVEETNKPQPEETEQSTDEEESDEGDESPPESGNESEGEEESEGKGEQSEQSE